MSEADRLLVVIHGVNLNLLGKRPGTHYGTVTLADLEQSIAERAHAHGWRCVCHQTNHEGEFVELVHRYRQAAGLIVNPGAWTHYSYAIRDALEMAEGPVAEVHLSDVMNRESWRKVSVIADVADIRIWGRGPDGYLEAVDGIAALRSGRDQPQTDIRLGRQNTPDDGDGGE